MMLSFAVQATKDWQPSREDAMVRSWHAVWIKRGVEYFWSHWLQVLVDLRPAIDHAFWPHVDSGRVRVWAEQDRRKVYSWHRKTESRAVADHARRLSTYIPIDVFALPSNTQAKNWSDMPTHPAPCISRKAALFTLTRHKLPEAMKQDARGYASSADVAASSLGLTHYTDPLPTMLHRSYG